MSHAKAQELIVYYDGQCGLCHLAVVFLLKRDRTGLLHFLPTQTARYRQFARDHGIAITPRSLLVWDPQSGVLLSEAAAVLRLLPHCGPLWRFASRLLGLMPLAVLTAVYRAIARVRHRIFPTPRSLWPVVPPGLRPRLLADQV
ncbi:MAG: DUF393 domain-containing protein [bacterium]|nr:DUF393 domain-containing protein [bacterium]